MVQKDYLTIEEQFQKELNIRDIPRIKDCHLRSIRHEYSVKRQNAFLDEHGIPDCELGRVFDDLDKREKSAIEAYIKQNNLDFTLNWDETIPQT